MWDGKTELIRPLNSESSASLSSPISHIHTIHESDLEHELVSSVKVGPLFKEVNKIKGGG